MSEAGRDKTVRGRCLCGAVEFELTAPLGPMTHCHCRSCRLSRGVAFVTWTSVPPERFAYLAGEADVTWFRSSATVRWGSCRICSSPMFYVADAPGHPEAPQVGHVYVSAGALTGDFAERPAAHVSYEEHVAWAELHDDLPRYLGKTQDLLA